MLYFSTMELWLTFSLISAVTAGLLAFTQKISAVRRYNSSLFNGYSAGIASVFGFIVAGIYEGFGELTWLLILIALLSGITSLLSTNFRVDSLKHIDTTISLPIHKFISPLFVLIFGIVLFNEHLTILEWIGIIVGMFVPLLLINKAENNRQNNLHTGLILVTVSALLSAVAVVINKYGTELFTSVVLFVAITQAFMALSGAFLYKNRRPNKIDNHTHIFDYKLLKLAFFGGIVQFLCFVSIMLALTHGGALAVVYTIQSLYIVIPIVLSIIFFKEHWDMKKVIVIGLSLIAIALMQ